MTHKFMLGVALTALMLSAPLAQAANTAPTPNATAPAASYNAPAKPAANTNAQAKPATGTNTTAQAQPAGGQPQFVMSQKPDQWLATTFRGTKVLSPDNKAIGDVTDILFDKSGKIEAYIVSVGGFLGMGAKEVAIAPASFTVVPGAKGGADQLKLQTNEKQLKQAENFKPYAPPHPTTTGSAAGGSTLLGGGTHHSPTGR